MAKNEEGKKKKNIFKILLVILISIIVVSVLIMLGYRIVTRVALNSYYSQSSRLFNMPGLSSNIILQGIDYDEKDAVFVFAGYRSGDQASSLYIVNPITREEKRVDLCEKDGKKFTGHAGGVCVNGEYIYLAGSSSGCVFVYSLEDAISCNDGGEIRCMGRYDFKTENDKIRVSFVGKIDGELVVGEYCKTNNLISYNTPQNHHVQTADGERGGLCVTVKFDESNAENYGLDTKLSKAYIVPDITQGICEDETTIYASCSSGFPYGTIYSYDKSKLTKSTINVLDQELPVYIMDSTSQIKKSTVPPMCEEIIILGDKMYIVTEAASSKYIFGMLIGLQKMYGTNVGYFK